MSDYQMITAKDAKDFFSSFSSFLSNIFLYILTAIKRHWIVASCTFLCVIFSGAYYLLSAKAYYKSTMTCHFTSMSKKIYGDMLRQLDDLAQSRSYSALATTLHISRQDASTIHAISGTNITGAPLYDDFSADAGPIYITLQSTSKSTFPIAQQALIEYLNSGSPFRARRNVMEKEQSGRRIQYLTNDISLLDSIIIAYTVYIRKASAIHDSSIVSLNIPRLIDLKRSMEDNLLQAKWRFEEMEHPIEAIYGFASPDDPITNNNKRSWLLIVLCGFIASVALTTLFRLFQMIK